MPVEVEDVGPLWDLLGVECAPRDLLRRSRGVIMEGLMLRLEALKPYTRGQGTFEMLRAVRLDGYEAVAMQQGWGLFNPTRARAASRWAVDRLRQGNVLRVAAESLEASLTTAAAGGESSSPAVRLVIIPGDPANRNFMVRGFGLAVAADAQGVVLVQIWPSDGNLRRLPGALARAAVHQCAVAADGALEAGRRPATAEMLRIEARADRLASDDGHCDRGSLWSKSLGPPPDLEQMLQHAAEFSHASTYDELDTNIYGTTDQGATTRVPRLEIEALEPDERQYTLSALAEEQAETEPSRVAAALYGDPAARLWGHDGVGVSSFAGFQVAVEFAERYP